MICKIHNFIITRYTLHIILIIVIEIPYNNTMIKYAITSLDQLPKAIQQHVQSFKGVKVDKAIVSLEVRGDAGAIESYAKQALAKAYENNSYENDFESETVNAKKLKQQQSCEEGKMINPTTGKCIKVDGRIGRRLLRGNTLTTKTPKAKIPKTPKMPKTQRKPKVPVPSPSLVPRLATPRKESSPKPRPPSVPKPLLRPQPQQLLCYNESFGKQFKDQIVVFIGFSDIPLSKEIMACGGRLEYDVTPKTNLVILLNENMKNHTLFKDKALILRRKGVPIKAILYSDLLKKTPGFNTDPRATK